MGAPGFRLACVSRQSWRIERQVRFGRLEVEAEARADQDKILLFLSPGVARISKQTRAERTVPEPNIDAGAGVHGPLFLAVHQVAATPKDIRSKTCRLNRQTKHQAAAEAVAVDSNAGALGVL